MSVGKMFPVSNLIIKYYDLNYTQLKGLWLNFKSEEVKAGLKSCILIETNCHLTKRPDLSHTLPNTCKDWITCKTQTKWTGQGTDDGQSPFVSSVWCEQQGSLKCAHRRRSLISTSGYLKEAFLHRSNMIFKWQHLLHRTKFKTQVAAVSWSCTSLIPYTMSDSIKNVAIFGATGMTGLATLPQAVIAGE